MTPAVSVQAIAPATATALPWRLAGELRVTVVVKAAFVIVPEGPMAIAEPDEIIRAEIHHANSAARSVRLTADTAPRLPRADVLLGGHACAPAGQTAVWFPVRLALFRERALLDKTIHVYGDDGGSVPFERIPLVYERAHGGLGFVDNPLGTGILELASKPNLLHPERADQVACFAPIARTWPARRRLIAGVDRKALDAPVSEIPAGFDWSYFNSAPLDQRVDPLHGDEWLVLEGMSPTLPRLRSRLPSARAVVLVYGLPGAPDGAQLEVILDTLRIDADRMGCAAVWRGDFAVPSEAVLQGLQVLAGVETESLPIAWPQPDEAQAPPPARAPEGPVSEEVIELSADVLITLSSVSVEGAGEEEAPPVQLAVPFAPDPATTPRAGGRTVTMVLPAERLGDTLAISQVSLEGPGPRSLPFVALQPTVPPPAWTSAPFAPEIPALVPPPVAPRIRLDNETPLTLSVDGLTVLVAATCELIPGQRPEAETRGGDEPLTLSRMHRTHATQSGSLPGTPPRCFASRGGARFEEVALRLDAVELDADAMKVALVWRGVLTAGDEAQPDVTALHLVMEEVGKEALTVEAARARFAG